MTLRDFAELAAELRKHQRLVVTYRYLVPVVQQMELEFDNLIAEVLQESELPPEESPS